MTVHPTDDVNMSQSSNDTVPTSTHIAATEAAVRQRPGHRLDQLEFFLAADAEHRQPMMPEAVHLVGLLAAQHIGQPAALPTLP